MGPSRASAAGMTRNAPLLHITAMDPAGIEVISHSAIGHLTGLALNNLELCEQPHVIFSSSH